MQCKNGIDLEKGEYSRCIFDVGVKLVFCMLYTCDKLSQVHTGKR